MYFKVRGSGIAGGYVDTTITPFDNMYIIKYKYRIEIGKYIKIPWVGKKFIGKVEKGGNSFKVEKEYLTEDFVKHTDHINIRGLSMNKIRENIFKFEKNIVSGEVHFEFDKRDPVEISKVFANAFGLTAEFYR